MDDGADVNQCLSIVNFIYFSEVDLFILEFFTSYAWAVAMAINCQRLGTVRSKQRPRITAPFELMAVNNFRSAQFYTFRHGCQQAKKRIFRIGNEKDAFFLIPYDGW